MHNCIFSKVDTQRIVTFLTYLQCLACFVLVTMQSSTSTTVSTTGAATGQLFLRLSRGYVAMIVDLASAQFCTEHLQDLSAMGPVYTVYTPQYEGFER
jgi:hypothetical protein